MSQERDKQQETDVARKVTGGIGRKLGFAFAGLLFLTMVVGMVAVMGMNILNHSVDQAIYVGGRHADLADWIDNALLRARRREKDYLLRYQDIGFEKARSEDVTAVQQEISTVHRYLTELAALETSEGDIERINQIGTLIDKYEADFLDVVNQLEERGFKDTGLNGELGDTEHELESVLKAQEEQANTNAMYITLLQLHRAEQDYLLRGEDQYVTKVRTLAEQLEAQLMTAGLSTYSTLVDDYLTTFDALVTIDSQIAGAIQVFRESTHAISPLVEDMRVEALRHQSAAVDNMTRATSTVLAIIIAGTIVSIVSGATMAVVISRSISNPIYRLADVARSVAAGNLKVEADIEARDEVGILADAFNHMIGRIREMINNEREQREALRENEERFRLAFENTNIGMCLVDLNGRLTRVNNQMSQIFGYSQAELENMTVNDIAHPKDLDVSPTFIRRAVSGEVEHTQFEKRYLHKDGHIVWGQVSSSLVQDAQGVPLYFISHVQDTTERKQTQEALQKLAYDLGERVKDLNCLYDISELVATPDISLEKIFQRVVDLIPPAWQYPQVTYARIIHEEQEFRTTGFEETTWKQAADIVVSGERVGAVEVCYQEKNPESGGALESEGPFLKEERNLLNAIAERLGRVIERQQAEQALRIERNNLKNIFETMEDGVYIVNQQYDILYVNPVLIKDFGAYEEQKCYEYFHDRTKECPWCKNLDVLAGKTVRWEWFSFKNGRTYDLIDTPLKSPDGSISKLEIFRDITERVQAEKTIQQQNEFLTNVIESLTHPFYVIDTSDYTVTMANSGASLAQSAGAVTCYALSHGKSEPCDGKSKHPCPLEIVKKSKKPTTMEHTHRTSDGESRVLEIHAYPIFDDNGDVVQMIEYLLDITERKRAEKMLKKSLSQVEQAKREWETTVDALPQLVCLLDDQRHVLRANRSVETWGLASVTNVQGWDVHELFHPGCTDPSCYLDGFWHQAWEELARGRSAECEAKDNILKRHLYIQVQPLLTQADKNRDKNPAAATNFAAVVIHDITERKQAEEKLRESEERYRAIFEQAADSIVLVDAETGALVEFNDQAHENLGYTHEEFAKLKISDLEVIETAEKVAEHIEKIIQVGTDTFETKHETKGGEIRDILASSRAISLGEKDLVQSIWHDVTERKQMEQTLKRRNRELALLNQASQTFSSTLDLDQVLGLVLEKARHLQEAIACSAWLLDAETGELVCQQASGVQNEIVRGWRLAPGEGIGGATVLSGKSLVVPDTHADERYFAGVDQKTGLALRSILSVPLRFKENIFGVIQVVDTETKRFGAQDMILLESLAAAAAIAIENARLYEQVQRHTKELERRVADRTRDLSILYEVTAIASQVLDLETALTRALEHILVVMQGIVGEIYILGETGVRSDEEALHIIVHQGISDVIAAQIEITPPGHSLVNWIFEHDESLLVPDISTDPRASDMLPVPSSLAYIGVPIRVRGQILGVLGVFKGEEQPPFSMDEITLLTSIADHMGIVVESAWLRQRIEQTAVLEERDRMARDLHDSITQSLYGLTLFAKWARDLCEEGDLEAARERVVRIGETAQQALKEMRLMVYELRPQLLEQDGLAGALQRRLDAVEKRAEVEVSLQTEISAVLPASVEEGLYRIAQEALNNALKHAAASEVTVWVKFDGKWATLKVEDNGSGFVFDKMDHTGGMGLTSMRERAKKLGGTLTVRSTPEQGTTVRVSVETSSQEWAHQN
ncbi:MAG: PAS domain S-box protein [Chloroflexi bacterium]|nr:PAS domain S-box protein [Chloroflexota bacterium]